MNQENIRRTLEMVISLMGKVNKQDLITILKRLIEEMER